ncbi:MAG: tetratricopeptide repeat protein, partial [Chlorobia bacterium]|nr:tetratricopeptide repeat protein [Fimbriimonadaceae bacterium]
KFGAPKAQGQSYGQAEGFLTARVAYLLGLVKTNRISEAAKIAGSIGSRGELSLIAYHNQSFLSELANSPAGLKLLEQVVRAKPNSPFWDTYIYVATRAGTIAKVVESLQLATSKPNLKLEDWQSLSDNLVSAYLASDQVEPAIGLLKKKFDAGPAGSVAQHGEKIALIGHLLKRKQWVNEGLDLARKARNVKTRQSAYARAYGEDATVNLFFQLGLTSEAERLLIDNYVELASSDGISGMQNSALTNLADFYHRLNRPDDVKVLLDRAPDWGVRDASEFPSGSPYSEYTDKSPMTYVAGWALAKTGLQKEALRLVYRVISDSPTYDPAYELLVDLAGDEAMPRLEAIYQADPFEERPLIWKSVLLKKQDKLEEAEKVIRQAIPIDPSDGETRNGRRLFAYTVLADIREARGDKEDAANLRQAVAAIRRSEEADKFLEVGLVKRSIDMYREALEMFGNAYCIQSRLAIQLMQQGRVKEAEEHYRRAYELMPESFGRVETHCFGCEQAFAGDVAQNIAEQVFAEFAEKNPKKPQVHYLLGYLRKEQGRFTEALTSYRKAVQLDPDYLNAWKEISALGQVISIPELERRTVAATLLRLDPLQRHGTQHSLGGVSPAEIWTATDRATRAFLSESTGSIYPLSASRIKMDQASKEREMGSRMFIRNMYSKISSPGSAVAGIEVITNLIRIIEFSGPFESFD